MAMMEAWKAARNALDCVLEAVSGERVVIICDQEKAEIGKAFSEGALELGLWVRNVVLKSSTEVRKEVPRHLLEVLSGQKPDLLINLLRGMSEETPFRVQLIHLETRDRRARLGHCPGVSIEMLRDGALALSAIEHKQMQNFAKALIRELGRILEVEVTSPSGTNLSLSTAGRMFFTDTYVDWEKMKWMNLPTGEVIVPPVEDSMEGSLVCDLAIGGIGSIGAPVKLTIEKGVVTAAHSKEQEVLTRVEKALSTDTLAKVVGEFAFGINPKTKAINNFLEAEKTIGTIHIAFGHNTDMPGGRNSSKNHMDFLISKPTVKVTMMNGDKRTILEDGKFLAPS